MVPTALWLFKKCPTAAQTATVAITNGHNAIVAVLFETAANPVHISSRISYVFAVLSTESVPLDIKYTVNTS